MIINLLNRVVNIVSLILSLSDILRRLITTEYCLENACPNLSS